MRLWWFGTPEDDWQSMGVISDGNSYGIPEGLIYSFPVRIENGDWKIVEGLGIDDFSRMKMDATADELKQERDAAMGFIES